MNNNLQKTMAALVAFFGISFSAHAELIDQFPAANSEFANASTRVYGAANAGLNLYITGNGTNRTVILAHHVRDYSQGISNYWRGNISPDDVTVNGIGQITVHVNTCHYTPSRTWGTDACGQVDVTFTKGDFLWVTNGSIRFQWDPLVNTINGGIKTFSANVTGFVKGVDMISAFRPAMGIYTNVQVIVELPDDAS